MQKRNGIWYTSGNVPITDFQQIIELDSTYPNADNSGFEIADPHPADNQFAKWVDAVPAMYGTLLMNMLRTTEGPFTPEDKKFLVDLAADLGPDWLDRLRGAVAFMIKAEKTASASSTSSSLPSTSR